MSNKRLTVWIDGREALPVRAIPYVSGWSFSTDRIARIFSTDRIAKILAGEHPDISPHRLTCFDASNPIYAPTAPRDWENIGIKMARQIMAVFEKYEQQGLPKEVGNFGSEDYLPPKDLTQETHCSARRDELREATAPCLPAGVFVWLEEFNRLYVSLGYKFPDHKLVLDPILEAEEVPWVMKGFSDYGEKALPSVQSIVALPPDAVQPASNVEEDENITPNNADWRVQARAIADELFDRDTKLGCRDSLKGYSTRTMDIMQERGIKGSRGIMDNSNTIMREALQGKKWWQNKSK